MLARCITILDAAVKKAVAISQHQSLSDDDEGGHFEEAQCVLEMLASSPLNADLVQALYPVLCDCIVINHWHVSSLLCMILKRLKPSFEKNEIK